MIQHSNNGENQMLFAINNTVIREYRFSSAHRLPFVPDGHKCKVLHGHNYKMHVVVTADALNNGFVVDFWDLDAIVEPLRKIVDHHYLNEIEGLENPTAEIIAAWFLTRIGSQVITAPSAGPGCRVVAVRVFEEEDCSAIAENAGPPITGDDLVSFRQSVTRHLVPSDQQGEGV